ncbi:hypothetical protein DPEC_G00027560 [Dallia pectoralis]|uniref:Uncharacterized protein n=1 Tax=Dallia pectoralis TaxID=75939 RepID=A0ACC2HIB3_DALPE|nr:hypothetical protein DPEC_G00027560 [Dallia pectoralis]
MAQSRRRCYCSVPCCSNNKQHFPYLSFHDFPVDPEIRCLWVRAIKRDEGPAFKILRGSTYVCSQHFAPDDKVTSFSGRVRLNQGAVPSRFHWNDWGKGRRQRSRRLNGLDDSQEMPVPGNSTAETLSADAVATDHDYAWRPSLVVEMACKKGISDGTVCPQRVQAKSEQSEVEILSRGDG